MSFCYLTAHPQTYASRRILEESQMQGLKLHVLNPLNLRLNTSQANPQRFAKTLNRFSAVDASDPYLFTLMESPLWGEQFNRWETRAKLWDKTRQTLWMQKNQWPTIPMFVFRGELHAHDSDWREFCYQVKDGWVLKVNRGQKGIGIHFFKTEIELLSWLETLWRLGDQDFLIQPKLDVINEYRVTYLEQNVWSILKREASHEKKNFAQGGSAQEIKLQDCSQKLSGLIDQMSILAATYTSIDLLETPEGLFVSDINLVPGFEQLEQVSGRNFAKHLLKVIF